MNYDLVFLVVDDMEGMRRILTNILHHIGMRNILTASNGMEAWQILQTHKVDVLILDWNMPAMSGLELLVKLRASKRFADLPVMMMTSESERYQVQTAIEAGVSAYLVKPFTAGLLESCIRRVIVEPHLKAQVLGRQAVAVPAVRNCGKINFASNRNCDAADADKQAMILLVDDVADNLDILVDVLSDDYLVRAANSGERALKALTSSTGSKLPDLILLDVMMPGMDGFEVCRRIKANPDTAEIPVIFLSAMSESVDVAKGFAVGAVDFITKPADPPILKARIATHLKLRCSIAELHQSRLTLIEQNKMLEDNLRLREEVERISQHDLKNPIAGIISFASILQEDGQLQDDQKEIIGYIEQSAYRLLNMVNLSLGLFKMEQGSYALDPSLVDLNEVLNHTIKEKAREMASREISVAFKVADSIANNLADNIANHGTEPTLKSGAMRILGDELLCYSMFSNLLKNAMEASGPDKVIMIELQSHFDAPAGSTLDHATAQPWVTVRISNDGVVPKDIRARFFDKFSTSGKQGGTGLGAFSAQLIARTQGGEITMATSDESNTTTISVTLPGIAL